VCPGAPSECADAHQGPIGTSLLQRFNTPEQAFLQVQRAIDVAKPATGIFSSTFETTVSVGGAQVGVRGALVDGVYKIGTILKW
jgi:hypothetical protein